MQLQLAERLGAACARVRRQTPPRCPAASHIKCSWGFPSSLGMESFPDMMAKVGRTSL